MTKSVTLMGEFSEALNLTKQEQMVTATARMERFSAAKKSIIARRRVVECRLGLAKATAGLASLQCRVAEATKELAEAEQAAIVLENKALELEVAVSESEVKSAGLQNLALESLGKLASHSHGLGTFGSKDIRTAARVSHMAKITMQQAKNMVGLAKKAVDAVEVQEHHVVDDESNLVPSDNELVDPNSEQPDSTGEDSHQSVGRTPAEHQAWLAKMARGRRDEQDRQEAAKKFEDRQRGVSSSSGSSGFVEVGARKKSMPVAGAAKPVGKVKLTSVQKALPEEQSMVKVFISKQCQSHAEYL